MLHCYGVRRYTRRRCSRSIVRPSADRDELLLLPGPAVASLLHPKRAIRLPSLEEALDSCLVSLVGNIEPEHAGDRAAYPVLGRMVVFPMPFRHQQLDAMEMDMMTPKRLNLPCPALYPADDMMSSDGIGGNRFSRNMSAAIPR
jgi:hypothetical protein